ncbi:SAM-dependent methyltransferase [Microcoleus sp. FACHB-1515]|uniref:class I SAM-dependent methyltransferase n=1 Tax=Cyanophyceae TaxID=3028117 RepID=UPI0016839971|nr:SAM-dependent methyltransferase [Microcoleus sp. FACHB-1515]MBD2090082.1 SAM-dependent methyltransferase [Microcoleus sp. FACHB-1515]
MSLNLGKSTNKGTALMKLAHQFQPEIILQDEFVGWFFDDAVVQALKEDCLNLSVEPTNDAERFQQIAYWYTILREKYVDEVIERALESNCKQLLLLGSGYDTRFFRIGAIREKIATFEVDLPETIADKQKHLLEKLGNLPPRLTLIPLDFNHDNLSNLSNFGFDKAIATAYVWQGVSYYLPKESVSQVLDFIRSCMTPDSVLVFDCCSPLMTFKNDQVPGIATSIDRLTEIGEPFLFGMYADEMQEWLEAKGFQDIRILQQNDLEEKFLHRRTLPSNMWYVVTARALPEDSETAGNSIFG